MHNRGADVESGAVPYYGIDLMARYRCAATYVNEIEPADLPAERSKEFNFAINLTIPLNVLARADRVIR